MDKAPKATTTPPASPATAPVEGAPAAAPAAPPREPGPNDLSLPALLWRVGKLPAYQQVAARDALLQLRGWRILVVGPQGGGKTTAITAMAARLGRISVVALDRDMKPTPGMVMYRMPQPEVRTEIPELSRAHAAAIADMRVKRAGPLESHIYLLDTVTTLYAIISSFKLDSDQTHMMGLDTTDMGDMHLAKKEAQVCLSWAQSIWRLCGKSCELSTYDGPLVFAVTEHAKPLTKGEYEPKYDKEGKAIVNLAFHSWVPQIGRATGNKIEGQPDLVIGYSMDSNMHGPWTLKCDWTGAHMKHRLTPQELLIFAAIMSGKRMDRLALALQAIYTRRKAMWLQVWCGITVPGLGDASDTPARWVPADANWTPGQ